MHTGRRLTASGLLMVAAMAVSVSSWGADCGCSVRCGALNYACIQSCQLTCDRNAQTAGSRAVLKENTKNGQDDAASSISEGKK